MKKTQTRPTVAIMHLLFEVAETKEKPLLLERKLEDNGDDLKSAENNQNP